MKQTGLTIHPSFVRLALRNCGYNSYTSILDIIDNSLEPNVASSFVKVDFATAGNGNTKDIKAIFIIDDGSGMSEETLHEAMSLGSQTGKNGEVNLGMYGVGLKSAALSIGQTLEVFTKQADSDLLYYSKISIIGDMNDEIFVGHNSYGKDTNEYQFFMGNTKTNHGTIVVISDLDRLSNNNYYSYRDTLYEKIGECYNKFIDCNTVKFFVVDKQVQYVELMGNLDRNILMKEGNFEVDEHTISYKAYNIPLIGDEKELDEEDKHCTDSHGNEYLERNLKNQGLYIYRNNRLVGKALTLGLWVKHSTVNGFRCEIYVDGNCDYLFGSTFTKVVNEKTKDTIKEQLLEQLLVHIKPLQIEAQLKYRVKNKLTPEEKKAQSELYKKVTDKQNKNMMLKVNRNINSDKEKEKKDNDDKEHNTRGPQKNPTKERIHRWLGGFREEALGKGAEMYTIETIDSKYWVIINTSHPFYENFYSKLDNDLKFIMAQIMSCDISAKQQVNYYDTRSNVAEVIDSYEAFKANEVMKSLKVM